MAKIRFLLPAFFLIYTSVIAQDQGKIIEYDLGQVSGAQTIQRKYEIKEKIKSAVSLCECVKIKVIPKENSSLLEIEFDPTEYNGATSQEVKLLDEHDNLITLRIKAYVKNTNK